jgi:hypothetical protein
VAGKQGFDFLAKMDLAAILLLGYGNLEELVRP